MVTDHTVNAGFFSDIDDEEEKVVDGDYEDNGGERVQDIEEEGVWTSVFRAQNMAVSSRILRYREWLELEEVYRVDEEELSFTEGKSHSAAAKKLRHAEWAMEYQLHNATIGLEETK